MEEKSEVGKVKPQCPKQNFVVIFVNGVGKWLKDRRVLCLVPRKRKEKRNNKINRR